MPTKERIVRPASAGSNILSWFTNLFRRGQNWMINLGTREVLPDINQHNAIEFGFNANAAVYAIVKKDAEKFGSIPRYVYDAKSMAEKDSKRIPIDLKAVASARRLAGGKAKELTKLLNRPNPYQGRAAFNKLVRAYYKTEGEAMIWLNRGDNRDRNGNILDDMKQDAMPVLEMYPLPVDQVTVVPDPDNLWGVSGYILKAGGNSIPIRKNDVIHWKDINMQWDASTKIHLRGMTPLKPGKAVLQQNNDATLGATRMYQNDGAKGILFAENVEDVTPTQESQIRSVVDRKVNNNDIKGAVASIFGMGKLDFLEMGASSVDMQLLEGKTMSFQELCALLGPPYELFQSGTAYANKEWAQKNWVSNDIMTGCEEFDDELNRRLLTAFQLQDVAVIASDFSQLPELQKNLKELAEWLASAWWITPNEKREIMGYEKLGDEFDEPLVPSSIIPLSQLEETDDGMDDIINGINSGDYPPKTVGAPAKQPAEA